MAQYRTRTWKLIFGRPVNVSAGKTTNIYDSMNGPKAGSGGLYEVGSDSGPANIEFSLKKDNSKDPNKGYVTVYNLSQDTVNFLEETQTESLAVVLEAGFDGINVQIFAGTVEKVVDEWDGPTRKTKMVFGDGVINITTSKSSRSYRKGTPLDQVVKDLVSDLGLPVGRIVKAKNKTLQYSMSFSGNTANNLRKLADNNGCTFSVQDGAAYWTVEGKRFGQAVFEISAETGMHGSPKLKNPEGSRRRKKKGSKKSSKEDNGIVVTTALNGAILPESTIYLKSRKYTGFYKVTEVEHKGSLESGEWSTTMTLVEAKGGIIDEDKK